MRGYSLQAIFVDLKPDPVKILDIATIVRSPTEQDLGPWFYIDARQTPIFIEVTHNCLYFKHNGI